MTLSGINSVNNTPFPQDAAEDRQFTSSDSTLAGKIRNIWNTFVALIRGCFEAEIPGVSKRGRMAVDISIANILQTLALNAIHVQVDISLIFAPIEEHSARYLTETIKSRINPDKPTLLPFVVQGKGLFARRHIVMLTIDHQNKQARYFDSKGRSMHDYETHEGVNVSKLFESTLTNNGFTIHDSFEPRQKDTHSCGYHVVCQAVVEMGLIPEYNHNDPRQTIIDNNWNAYGDLSEYRKAQRDPDPTGASVDFLDDPDFCN